MLIRLNVIDREGKKNSLDVEEGTTIRDAIEEKPPRVPSDLITR